MRTKLLNLECDGLRWRAIVGVLDTPEEIENGGDILFAFGPGTGTISGYFFGSDIWPSSSYYVEKMCNKDTSIYEMVIGYLCLLSICPRDGTEEIERSIPYMSNNQREFLKGLRNMPDRSRQLNNAMDLISSAMKEIRA